EAAGCRLLPVQLPASFKPAVAAADTILRVEAASFHRQWFPARRREYGAKLSEVLDAGLQITAIHYFEARRLQQQATRQMLDLLRQVDFLATPSAPIVAPPGLEWTGDPAFNTPFSVFGLPAMNLPASYAPNGLASGFQIAGRPWSEAQLLRLALTLEESGFGRFVAPC
ncbi:MAG: amidase family protein, partial [Acidobacteria bacterium]|nr:amidase family protein [Acidobacteriota bacterium]